MHPGRQIDWPEGRPFSGRGGFPTSGTGRRAVVAEQHPAVRAVLEHLLAREGYEMWRPEASPKESSGPVLLLVGSEDGDGLHVFETQDVAGTLSDSPPGEDPLRRFLSKTDGIHAFVPKPFGTADVLRVVRVVGGFDSRKKSPEKHAAG